MSESQEDRVSTESQVSREHDKAELLTLMVDDRSIPVVLHRIEAHATIRDDALPFCSNIFAALDDAHMEEKLSPQASEGHSVVLQLFSCQQALVKTVNNHTWSNLIGALQLGNTFRTSTSLPPPMGKHMRLFGQIYSNTVGLIWDVNKLDLSDAYMWPSGYFAKSDYNVGVDGTLSNGRGDHLVTLGQLREANETFSVSHAAQEDGASGKALPFNEVLVSLRGTHGLVGIFARSTLVEHLLGAMGVRSLFSHVFGEGARDLPLFVLTQDRGASPFGKAAQMQLVQEFLHLSSWPCSGNIGTPRLPVDTRDLALSYTEELIFHGVYGITEDALTVLIKGIEPDPTIANQDQFPADPTALSATRTALGVGLCAAVVAENSAGALALVKHAVPLLFVHAACAQKASASIQSAVFPNSIVSTDFATYLRSLAIRSQEPDLLVPLGAAIVVDELSSGRVFPRIIQACDNLQKWLAAADSLLFRLQSWYDSVSHHPPSERPKFFDFVTDRAVRNRTIFHDALYEMENDYDAYSCLTKLHELLQDLELHHPCLRLEILQRILGLSENFDIVTIHGVVNLTLQCLRHAAQYPVYASWVGRNAKLQPCRDCRHSLDRDAPKPKLQTWLLEVPAAGDDTKSSPLSGITVEILSKDA